jgi:DNA-binding NarL/FixJ family response regulator
VVESTRDEGTEVHRTFASAMTAKSKSSPIKVVLVEDHEMFRERLAELIAKTGEFTVCGEADNIQAGLKLIESHKPDIAIVDITLRGSSGLELIKDLKAQGLEVPVLVLSMHAESLYAERALHAGAKGYITKQEASATLLKAIRQVFEGKVYLSDGMTATMLGKLSGQSIRKAHGMETLTDRELEVFQLVGKGHNSREIAELIHLGETTVDTYRARIKDKLGLRNAADLYSRAAQWVQEQGM